MHYEHIYNYGDRVICISDNPSGNDMIYAGYLGTVVDVKTYNPSSTIGIAWDDFIDGHDLGGNAEDGRGWYINTSEIRPYRESDEAAYEYTDADIMEFLSV